VKYLLLLSSALFLVVAGCEMPGVDKVRQEVNDSLDDLADEIGDLDLDKDTMLSRIEVLESEVAAFTGVYTGDMTDIEMPDFDIPDITGIVDEIALMRDSLDSSLLALNASMEEMQIELEEMTLANDSLLLRIDDLEDEITGLEYTVNHLGSSSSSGSESSTSRGGSGGGSGTSGSGSGSSGGSSGGSTTR
jgi:hypothetical protein